MENADEKCDGEISLLKPASRYSDELVLAKEGVSYLRSLGSTPIELVNFFGDAQPEVYLAVQLFSNRDVCFKPAFDVHVKFMPNFVNKRMPNGKRKLILPIKSRLIAPTDEEKPSNMYAIAAKIQAVTGIISSGFSYSTLAYYKSDLWRGSFFHKALKSLLIKSRAVSKLFDVESAKVGPVVVNEWDSMYCNFYSYPSYEVDSFLPPMNTTLHVKKPLRSESPETDKRTLECLNFSYNMTKLMNPLTDIDAKPFNGTQMAELLEILVKLVNKVDYEDELCDRALEGQRFLQHYMLSRFETQNRTRLAPTFKFITSHIGHRIVEGFPDQIARYEQHINEASPSSTPMPLLRKSQMDRTVYKIFD